MNEKRLETLFLGRVVVRTLPIADRFSDLHPVEQNHIQHVVMKRREEFSTGRICAHLALNTIGMDRGPVLPGEKREPLWPSGTIGSISHSGKCCIAAVSKDPDLLSLGIDVETREGINQGVRDLICTPSDLDALGPFKDTPEFWKLIFSAKESIYKSLYPIVKCWIGFTQAHLAFDFEALTFCAELDDDLPVSEAVKANMRSRFLLTDDYIFTCMEIQR